MVVAKKWFFMINNEVQGPFVDSEVQKLSELNSSGLVWGQGLAEWVTVEEWKKTLNELQGVLTSLQADMIPQWRVKQGDFEAGPFIYDQLIQLLKAHPHPGDVLLLQENESSDWKSIYTYPTLVEEVGITRRDHLRVPISGVFVYEKEGAKYESLLTSISEGGIGVLEAQNLSVGDKVKGYIESPQLPLPFNCTCEALYVQNESSWGLRFVNLPIEFNSLVISYTQKFSQAKI